MDCGKWGVGGVEERWDERWEEGGREERWEGGRRGVRGCC